VSITAIKGMNDILPGDVETWQQLEATARRVFHAFGFAEIRMPVVERTELFSRSIGETTDIVEKEMYTFADKGGTSMTLRPEGTASVMRAYVEHKLYADDPVRKLYYLGPMFRHERPQKGRYRQFHQIGAEAVGVDSPLMDAQMMAMLDTFFREADIDGVSLEINSLGCPDCRPAYREALIAFLEGRLDALCEDCRRRYRTNPLRVIDCKVPGCREATVDAPSILDHLCGDCRHHFGRTQQALTGLQVPFAVNPRMVRGLDYYTRTTFEMVTDRLGAQNAVAAGGRYDGLVQAIGGPATPGIGFAMGLERLVLLREQNRVAPPRLPLFLAALGEAAADRGFALMTGLQRAGLMAEMDYAGRSLKAQMRRANKLAARYVLILGDNELERGEAELRDMDNATQEVVALDGLAELLQTKLASLGR